MNLFVLSDGAHINLDHVVEIPSRCVISNSMKEGRSVPVVMSNKRVEHLCAKDAWEIVEHLYSGEELSPKPETKREWKIGDFMKTEGRRIGTITGTDRSYGVYGGHCRVWFGEHKNGIPIEEHIPIVDDWQFVPTPTER